MNTQALEALEREMREMAGGSGYFSTMTYWADQLKAIRESGGLPPELGGLPPESGATERETSITALRQALKEANAKLALIEALADRWEKYKGDEAMFANVPATVAYLRAALRGEP